MFKFTFHSVKGAVISRYKRLQRQLLNHFSISRGTSKEGFNAPAPGPTRSIWNACLCLWRVRVKGLLSRERENTFLVRYNNKVFKQLSIYTDCLGKLRKACKSTKSPLQHIRERTARFEREVMHMSSACPRGRIPGQSGEYKGMD